VLQSNCTSEFIVDEVSTSPVTVGNPEMAIFVSLV
jgi:hypothetical protein